MGWFDWFRTQSPQDAARAHVLMGQSKYADAEQALQLASEPEHLAMLAECQFQQGRAAEAAATAQRGLDNSTRDEGKTVLWGTLYEACRYAGDAAGAARACVELARRDRKYLAQAAIVRQGEPLLRVVADIDGQRYEIDEVLVGVAGPVRLMFERNRLSLRAVAQGVKRCEEMMSSRDFNLETFLSETRALTKLCPYDPGPRYLLGQGLACQGSWDEADQWLRETEKLAPGWFLVRSALDMLRPKDAELFRNWLAASEGQIPDQTRKQIVDKSLERWPDCAHLHHLHGKQLKGRNRAAEKAHRKALELATTPDLQTRICFDLAAVTTSDEERLQLLRRAVELGADLPAAANARIVLAFEGGPAA
jgi:hypothetical protein